MARNFKTINVDDAIEQFSVSVDNNEAEFDPVFLVLGSRRLDDQHTLRFSNVEMCRWTDFTGWVWPVDTPSTERANNILAAVEPLAEQLMSLLDSEDEDEKMRLIEEIEDAIENADGQTLSAWYVPEYWGNNDDELKSAIVAMGKITTRAHVVEMLQVLAEDVSDNQHQAVLIGVGDYVNSVLDEADAGDSNDDA